MARALTPQNTISLLQTAGGRITISFVAPPTVAWLTITGTTTENQTLTAALGGGAPVVTTYQWLRGYTPISGATSSTYVLTAADVGRLIRVVANGDQYSAPVGPVIGLLSASFVSLQAGYERWQFDSPLVSPGTNFVDVLKPAGWTSSGAYKALYMLPALSQAFEDATAAAVAADIANLNNCVVIIPYFSSNEPWYGKRADGGQNQHDVLTLMPARFAVSQLGCASGRDNHRLLGYSKSGWGAFSLILRNPSVFGYAYAWDAPWVVGLSNWSPPGAPVPDYGQDEAFGTKPQMELYDPLTLVPSLAAASIGDKKRVSIAGFNFFASDITPMSNALTAAGVLFGSYIASLPSHSYDSGWLAGASLRLMEVNAPPSGAAVISGTAETGKTLTVATGTIADPNGLGAFLYQWLRDGSNISGATNTTYAPALGDVGAMVSCRVSWTDGDGYASSLTSNTLGPVVLGSAVGWNVLGSSGTSYSVTLAVLDSAGTSYTVASNVLDSAGVSYAPA